jgi:hypothetical protein
MGRQTSVALSEADEQNFLVFLRRDTEIRIYRRAAPSPELLSVAEFPPRASGESAFTIWNTAFPWRPEYAQWHEAPFRKPDFYLKNTAGAPLLEYMRHALGDPKPLVRGRVYWNTDFAIHTGPEYDRRGFSRWYDHVVRWLRTNGNRVEIAKNWFQYWLPGAWATRQVRGE